MRELFENCYGISDKRLLEQLISAGKIESFPRGTVVVEAGKEQRYLLILLEGVVRGYLLDADGREITDCFAYRKGEIVSGCNQLGAVSQINIETLTECRCVVLQTNMVLELIQRNTSLLLLYNQYLAAALDRHWEVKMLMYRCTAMQRYQWFLDNYAEILGIVSNRHIASFLSMTPVTLSRLRRQMREPPLL